MFLVYILMGINMYAGDFLSLRYDKPASRWMEALPLGNGRLGLMVYGNTYEEIISLNEISFWKGAHNIEANKGENGKYFKEIRDLILENKLDEAHRIASSNLEGDMSSFGTHLQVGDLKLNLRTNINNIIL